MTSFWMYEIPEDEFFGKLWDEAVIALDANILLNSYRLRPESVEEMLGVLEAVEDRLWVPYQAGAEYHENRDKVIRVERPISELARDAEEAFSQVSKLVEELGRTKHPTFRSKKIQDKIATAREKSLKAIKKQEEKAAKHASDSSALHDRLMGILDGKFGDRLSTEVQVALFQEAEVRYSFLIPPGYGDAIKKDGYRKYGDYIIWHELLQMAAAHEKPVVFVTDDRKEDWFLREGNQIKGPRPELRAEFHERTGQSIWIYTGSRFLEHAKGFLDVGVDEKTLTDAERVGQQSYAVDDSAGVAPLRIDPQLWKSFTIDPDLLKPMRIDPDLLKPMRIDPDLLKAMRIDPDLLKPMRIDPDLLKPMRIDPALLKPIQIPPELLAQDPTADPSESNEEE